jgi:hypothetical protein
MNKLFEWIFDVIKKLLSWFLEKVAELGDLILKGALEFVNIFLPVEYVQYFADFLGKADYFVPLREMAAFGTAIFAAWAAMTTYRLIKSWIPSVSGT